MARDNLSVHLAERPKADIVVGETFKYETKPAPTSADVKDGEILVEALYLSLDPAMRTYLNEGGSYMPAVKIGDIMRGMTICRVLASKSKQASENDYVIGFTGWQEYAILKEGQFEPQSAYPNLQQPTDLMSALGLTSVTAWYGMVKIGEPKAGDLVVVSGAAGATGSVAGQIAKIKGAKVVGIAGSDDKCKWIKEELGYDAVLNYKDADFKKKFREATKEGIDVYFDNVGGEILDLALAQTNNFARIVNCGAISQYNTSAGERHGLRNYGKIVTARLRMQGFIVMDHPEHFPTARKELSQWLAEGKLKKTETIVRGGLRKAEQALVDLYKGVNTGKLMVEIKNPDESPSKL
ncbi:hypothetical protein S40285_04514 [Stachybotrys chlorohalonatus IBT 40285]|uniref:Dehydrogenase FUB6 n=1 Tax=Stachybotrys chlorohalonatus (strain IBT 40285) TaxID=1283841 RepID=A0A084QV11_STAC4|nr:hypothetical protein S40285_04514 [Stachybotrys chlorohalonata IBT 40285]